MTRSEKTIWLACALAAVAAGAGAGARAGGAGGQGQRWTLEGVLQQLDAAAGDFHSLSADIEHTKVTVVVDDKSTETGQILVRRDGKMRIEITKPAPRTILRNGDEVYLYNPKINRVEEYNLGKHRAMVDQYLLLGFGTKGSELRKNYLLTLLGEETLDKKKVVVLELTPKSETVRNQIAKVHVWIDEASWLPIQQKFFETGAGDYFIFHYTNLVRNTKIADSHFKAKWPKSVTRVKPRE